MTLQQLRNWHTNAAHTCLARANEMHAKALSGRSSQRTSMQYHREANSFRDLARLHTDAVKLLDSVQS